MASYGHFHFIIRNVVSYGKITHFMIGSIVSYGGFTHFVIRSVASCFKISSMASYGSFCPLHNSRCGKLRQLLPTP